MGIDDGHIASKAKLTLMSLLKLLAGDAGMKTCSNFQLKIEAC